MCEVQRTTTCQLPAEEQDYNFILQSNWKEDGFEILLLDRDCSWTGNVSWKDIQKLSQQLQMSTQEYLKTTKEALTTHGGAIDFSYTVADKQFIWKKKFEAQKNIKIKFGCVQMQAIPFVEATERVVKSVLNIANSLMDKVTILEKEVDKRSKEKSILMEQLLIYKKEMIETEELLYAKFLALLNTKKHKIAELESQLETRKHDANTSANGNAMDIDVPNNDDGTLPQRRRQKSSKVTKTNEKIMELHSKGVKRKPYITAKEEEQSSSRGANEATHYSSDTEVDDTDTEEEKLDHNSDSTEFIKSKDKLFSAIETDSDIPKRVKRGSKPVMVNKTQPFIKTQKSSSRNANNKEKEKMEEFSTQALLDDI